MIPPFDIFKQGPGKNVRWIESAWDVDTAKARIQTIGQTSPGEYVLFSQKTGDKLVIPVEAQKQSRNPSYRLNRPFRDVLDRVLRDAVEAGNASFGTLQLFEPQERVLKIHAHHGFSQQFLDFFETVSASDSCACGNVLKEPEGVFVDDVSSDPLFDMNAREVLLNERVHAVQALPLVSVGAQFIGVLAVHYRKAQLTPIPDSFLANAVDSIQRSARS